MSDKRNEPTQIATTRPEKSGDASPFNKPTALATQPPAGHPTDAGIGARPTILNVDRASRATNPLNPPTTISFGDGVQSGKDEMSDPITGLLVVTAGPGRGRHFALGHGFNSLGRSPGARVALDFGDATISQGAHFNIAYDPVGKQFMIAHGGGKNLVYLDGAMVMGEKPLTYGARIKAGDSTFRFVPICGPDFDWSMES